MVQEGALLNRTQAAQDAGLSEHQRKTALRVANVPDSEFESAVDSDNPPTVTELARMGEARPYLIPVGGDGAVLGGSLLRYADLSLMGDKFQVRPLALLRWPQELATAAVSDALHAIAGITAARADGPAACRAEGWCHGGGELAVGDLPGGL